MFWISVDREAPEPLIRQIYGQFRERILTGALGAGEPIPSSRGLARQLGVSRNVVLEAYAQLEAEGFLTARSGSGTRVAPGALLETGGTRSAPEEEPEDPRREDLVDFRTGVPALDRLPRGLLGRTLRDLCRDLPPERFGYGPPEGCGELRRSLAAYLRRSRGVVCSPSNLVVTTGAAQALYLAARLLERPEVAVEDPLHRHFQQTLREAGKTLVPVRADASGLRAEDLPPKLRPAFVFVTPSHQFPLGGILPIQRRIALLRYASQRGCHVVEDDYENEIRFSGLPIPALQGLAPDRVLYVGSFSKILSPSLRLGYLAVPPDLAPRARRLKYDLDNHSPTLEQLLLADLLDRGLLERHVASLRGLYRRRRDALCAALTEAFPGTHRILGASAGLHLVASFPGRRFTPELLARCEAEGVRVTCVEAHALVPGEHLHELVLGYGNLSEDRLAEGIRRLARALPPLP